MAMTRACRRSFSATALAIIMSLFSVSSFSSIEPSHSSFSVDLIHRDSPASPYHEASLSHSHRLGDALKRSHYRAYHLKPHPDKSSSNLVPDKGEYLLNISFGDPPRHVLAVADTGSDLTWIQCKTCTSCYNHTDELFDPRKSSTYKPIACNSKTCKESFDKCLPRNKGICGYSQLYGDGSSSEGNVATELVTLGSHRLPNITFGCGLKVQGIFDPKWAGIVGLGGGKLSLISQIQSLIKGKFSYCLIPNPSVAALNTSSKFNFGGSVFGQDVVSTPLAKKFPDVYYYLTLEAISVGHKRINIKNPSGSSNFSSNSADQEGNIIIDSGTTLTYLPEYLYDEMETTIKRAVKAKPVHDPQHALNLCYRSWKANRFPAITVHFKGADVKLRRENILAETGKGVVCLAFAPTGSLPIYGNLAQANFLIGYDLEKGTVSFKHTDCNKH